MSFLTRIKSYFAKNNLIGNNWSLLDDPGESLHIKEFLLNKECHINNLCYDLEVSFLNVCSLMDNLQSQYKLSLVFSRKSQVKYDYVLKSENDLISVIYYPMDKKNPEELGSLYIRKISKKKSEDLDNYLRVFHEQYKIHEIESNIFVLANSGTSLILKELSIEPSDLINNNYNDSVISNVNYVIESFKNNAKNGRIVILNGPPGTGKTHLIRGLVNKLPGLFVLIPASMVGQLTSPSILPFLIKTAQEHKKPINFILEDGDECIKSRSSSTLSIVSALLNLSDGIWGAVCDVRIIITSNMELDEIDPAVLRPGRLCKHIYVDSLPYEQSLQVLNRLTNNSNDSLEKRDYFLSELYQLSFNDNNQSNVDIINKKKKNLGFSLES